MTLDGLIAEMQAGFERLDRTAKMRFEALADQLRDINRRLGRLEDRLAEVEHGFTRVEGRIERLPRE